MVSINSKHSTNSRAQMAGALCCSLLFHLLLFVVLRSSPHFPLVVGSEMRFDLFWIVPAPPGTPPVTAGAFVQEASLKPHRTVQQEAKPADDEEGDEQASSVASSAAPQTVQQIGAPETLTATPVSVSREPASTPLPETALAMTVVPVAANQRQASLPAAPHRKVEKGASEVELQPPVAAPVTSGKELAKPGPQSDDAKRSRRAWQAASAGSLVTSGRAVVPPEQAGAAADPTVFSMLEKLAAKDTMLFSEPMPATSERTPRTGQPPPAEKRQALGAVTSAPRTTNRAPATQTALFTHTAPVTSTAPATHAAPVTRTTPAAKSATPPHTAAVTPPAAFSKQVTVTRPAIGAIPPGSKVTAAAPSGTRAAAPQVAAVIAPRPLPVASGAASEAAPRSEPDKPAERKGATIPSLHGDLKLVMVGASGLKLSVSFREYPKARRSKLQSRGEARRQQKIAPLIAQTGGEKQEAVIEIAREGVYLFVVESESGEPVKGTFTLKIFENGVRGKTSIIGTRTITGRTVLARILMPDGILWDDDTAFTGILQDAESTTKFNARSGLQWKEYNY
ncbi:MAG TPA: hypothetical protein VJ550_00260 [Geomonas sp.]|nr:hypothetical protein [Geomonas sp.]